MVKLFSCGTLASSSGVVFAPIVRTSSRETPIRFEPVGGTPRMLDPVTTISSSSCAAAGVEASADWGVGTSAGAFAAVPAVCAQADPLPRSISASSDAPDSAKRDVPFKVLATAFPPKILFFCSRRVPVRQCGEKCRSAARLGMAPVTNRFNANDQPSAGRQGSRRSLTKVVAAAVFAGSSL